MRETLKSEFAANMLRCNDDAAKAAFATFPKDADAGTALQIMRTWPDDPFVKAEKIRLLQGDGARSYLPTKEQQAKDIYAIATSDRVEPEDRLKAHRLYAEVMGHIEKPSSGVGMNVLNQGVMIVPLASNPEEWEKNALHQQQSLTSNAVN